MKRFLSTLGAVCVLIGASLMLPGGASAQPVCTATATGFLIEETSFFQIVPEVFGCFIGGTLPGTVSRDTLNSPGVVSDNITLANTGPAGPIAVTLHSDPVVASTGAPTIREISFGGGIDGVILSTADLGAPFDLTVHSDVGADTDPSPVPEPPTGLLMASAGMLPFALTFLRRRGKAKGQPSAA